MMKLKRCSICKQEVHWLIQHALRPEDQVIVSIIERNVPNWSQEDVICLPCFDRYKQHRGIGCQDIRICQN